MSNLRKNTTLSQLRLYAKLAKSHTPEQMAVQADGILEVAPDLAKAWPKSAKENLDNAKGFLNNPASMDHALETGWENPTTHTVSNGDAAGNYNPAAALRSDRNPMTPAEYEAHANNFHASRNPHGRRSELPKMKPVFDIDPPTTSNQNSPADQQHEADFWQDTEAQAEGKSLAALRYRATRKARSKAK